MRKEQLKTVEKVWGEEIWLVNSDKYCGKYLLFDAGAQSSYHYHPVKEETFVTMEGLGTLIIEGKSYRLAPFARPKTILPGEKHMVKAITDLILIEISTPHSDDDVVRLTQSSKASQEGLTLEEIDRIIADKDMGLS